MPTINIPYDLNRQIKALAEHEKRPITAVLADAIHLYREANKRHLKLDLRKLAFIFDTAGEETRNYLDMETGKIITLLVSKSTEQEINQIEAQKAASGQYLRIPGADPNAAAAMMRDFLTTVENKRLHDLLEVALNGRGAGTRFKNVLSGYPAEQQRWQDYKNQRLKERIARWLDEHYLALDDE